MFGFSLTKLVVLLVVVVFVWQSFKHFGGGSSVSRQKKKAAPETSGSIDTLECRVCGIYVSTAAGGCGRKDCPYG